MIIYVNGEYVSQEEAVISPYDHGFLYGLGVFETFRVYEGHFFLLENHLQRLWQGMKALNIEYPLHKEEVIIILKTLLEKNHLQHAYIRFNVSAGIGEIGLQIEPYKQPSILCFIKPLPVASGALTYKKARLLNIPRNTPEGSVRLKSHHYLNSILGKREIGTDMETEGIFLTKEGNVAEGIVSNVFFVKGNVVYTPCVETGILNGITRQYILALCREHGITVKEGYYTKEQLVESDEIFVTNSIQEIVGIKEIEGVPKASHTITTFLHNRYQQDRTKRMRIEGSEE